MKHSFENENNLYCIKTWVYRFKDCHVLIASVAALPANYCLLKALSFCSMWALQWMVGIWTDSCKVSDKAAINISGDISVII